LAIKAKVKRDGKWVTPAARELVPGDVIRLRLGDIVPADARLLDGDAMSVDQSALTGESLPATRNPGDAVFSGSIVRRGESSALVYATGTNTYFGKTAQLVEQAHTVSHFQKAVLKIGNYLILLAVSLVAVIIGFAIFRGDPILTTLQFALVLTVAAIPVAMPTVLSVTMAVGARLLARKKAIVSRLVAIEELAGVDVLCADKTGTLTQNKLTLGDPFSVNNVPTDQVFDRRPWIVPPRVPERLLDWGRLPRDRGQRGKSPAGTRVFSRLGRHRQGRVPPAVRVFPYERSFVGVFPDLVFSGPGDRGAPSVIFTKGVP
jgi:H+-transporting ATPase